MTNQEIKDEFLSQYQNISITELHSEILDEIIESIKSGRCLINGESPKNTEERIICIGYYFLSADIALVEMIRPLKELSPPPKITLSYRGKTYQY